MHSHYSSSDKLLSSPEVNYDALVSQSGFNALYVCLSVWLWREYFSKHAAYQFINLVWKLTAINLAFLQQGNISKYFPYIVTEQVVCFVRYPSRLSIFS